MDAEKNREFNRICLEMNWKRTIQRRAVFSAVYGNRSHPSVADVAKTVRKTIPDMTTDSICRILCDFSSAGFFRKMDGLETLRFDSNPIGHSHFVCSKCGKILDIDTEIKVPKLPKSCGKISEIEVRFSGICSDCEKNENKTRP